MSADPALRREITGILAALAGEGASPEEMTARLAERLLPELRRMADAQFRRERSDHTLQPTALVNEAYLRLVDQSRQPWESRAHFLGAAARVMRQILVDHARRRAAARRGGDRRRITLQTFMGDDKAGIEFEILALEEALASFAKTDPRAARVAEMRLFGGLSVREAAAALGVSTRTVDDDWALARMWLRRELGD